MLFTVYVATMAVIVAALTVFYIVLRAVPKALAAFDEWLDPIRERFENEKED